MVIAKPHRVLTASAALVACILLASCATPGSAEPVLAGPAARVGVDPVPRVDLFEMPFSWNLDDFPAFEYSASRLGVSPGLADPDRVYSIWAGEFQFLYEKLGAGVYILTMHPQTDL